MNPRHPATMLLLACLAVTGCGVPTEDHARPVEAGPSRNTPRAIPAVSATGPANLTLYLIKGDKLVAVTRRLPAEPTVETAVQDLLAGPTAEEKATGITSALLGSTVITKIELRDGVAVVELAADLEGTGRTDDVLAFAQLVCTLTNRPGISKVAFTRDGIRIRVPRADLSLTDQPLTPADYTTLQTGR